MKRHAGLLVLSLFLAGSVRLFAGESEVAAAPKSEAAQPRPEVIKGDFLLLAEEIDCIMANGAMETMEARIDVAMTATGYNVSGEKLLYVGATKIITVWGTPQERCTVVTENSTLRCDRFIYNTETGTGEPDGNIQVVSSSGATTTNIRSDRMKVEQIAGDENTSTTTRLSFTGRVMLDSKSKTEAPPKTGSDKK